MHVLAAGTHVFLHSLLVRCELNGATGIIIDYDGSKDRYSIRIGSQKPLLLLKRDNLMREDEVVGRRLTLPLTYTLQLRRLPVFECLRSLWFRPAALL